MRSSEATMTPDKPAEAKRRWVIHVFGNVDKGNGIRQCQRPTGDSAACLNATFHGEAVPAAERDALAKRVEELEGFFDGFSCPTHGNWFSSEPEPAPSPDNWPPIRYAICGQCHDAVKAERDAAQRTIRGLAGDCVKHLHYFGGCEGGDYPEEEIYLAHTKECLALSALAALEEK